MANATEFLIESSAEWDLYVGTNDPGDPVSDAFTHRFRIDYRLVPGMGYTHMTVNHSRNFVDPQARAHTHKTWRGH